MNKPLSEHPKLLLDPYATWAANEGVPIVEDFGVDLLEVQTAPWPRFGVDGAIVNLKGRGDFVSIFVLDLAPGAQTSPQKHMYEETVYVLSGYGSTTIETSDGRKHSFEWGPKSLFALPLNARYQHFNSSGRERARIASTNNLCMMLNLFHHERFVFDNNFDFEDRIGKQEYFAGEGVLNLVRQGNDTWETNFVPNLERIKLPDFSDRGAGGGCLIFLLADSSMHAHVSEMPAGTYKKAHRHGSGYHVMCVGGSGFSLMWHEGDQEFVRIDWKHGVVFPPANQQWHQHFTTSATPARYLATGFGSLRYPFTLARRQEILGEKVAFATSTKEGGDQIEYEDQDPRIHPLWLGELAKHGLASKMDRFFPR